jgi:hypothetical protein
MNQNIYYNIKRSYPTYNLVPEVWKETNSTFTSINIYVITLSWEIIFENIVIGK